jgi:hypothetical protein
MAALVIDMGPPRDVARFYACISGVDGDGGYMSHRIDKAKNEK